MNLGFLYFFALVGWALALMAFLPRLKVGHALLCALCGMLFVSYYGVIAAQVMRPAAYLLLYGGLAALLAGVLLLILNRRGLRGRIPSVGMGLFLLCAVAGIFLLRDVVISDHDSLSYWARIVKELFTYERFPIHGDTTMYHTDYIPLLASLQYCVMAVFGWQDASILYVTFSCILVAIAAIVDLLDERRGWAALAAVLLLYAYCVMGSPLFSTRADGPISALFAAGVLCLFLRRDDSSTAWLPTFCVTAVLAGFKIYTGLMLALVLGFCMLFSVRGAAKKERARKKPLLLLSLSALLLCLVMQFSWSGLYHYMTRLGDYEAAVAAVPYTGVAVEGARPVFSLSDLFSGNPRSGQLLSAFSQENLMAVEQLIADTFAAYGQSKLVWLWLFFLPMVPVCLFSTRQERGRILALLGVLLTAAVLYLLGLFGSYFVQAETSGAAVNYLVTVTTPLLLALVCLTIRAAASRGKTAIAGRVALPFVLAGMLLVTPPSAMGEQFTLNHELESYSLLAQEYYTTEIGNQLTPEDAKKHALLIECSYGASEVKSESGKTHAYQYFGMPLYVHVLQYPYGEYDFLDSISTEMLTDMLNGNRCDLLLLRIDDEAYWGSVQDALGLYEDMDWSIAAYDVIRQDGQLSFQSRAQYE
ncbi:MAG: hypothetical protein PHI98_05215 [Eubacteriales bacterium]|nr:hypothetical protein [Eubacteriales bacterium]